jgi:hypothetical protein
MPKGIVQRWLVERLDRQLELREIAHRDGVEQIPSLRVRIGAVELD